MSGFQGESEKQLQAGCTPRLRKLAPVVLLLSFYPVNGSVCEGFENDDIDDIA